MERRNGLPQNSGLDEQLWLASQNGDSEALRHLITRYDRLATSLCGSYCAAGMEREDLLQEAYLRPAESNSFSSSRKRESPFLLLPGFV